MKKFIKDKLKGALRTSDRVASFLMWPVDKALHQISPSAQEKIVKAAPLVWVAALPAMAAGFFLAPAAVGPIVGTYGMYVWIVRPFCEEEIKKRKAAESGALPPAADNSAPTLQGKSAANDFRDNAAKPAAEIKTPAKKRSHQPKP